MSKEEKETLKQVIEILEKNDELHGSNDLLDNAAFILREMVIS